MNLPLWGLIVFLAFVYFEPSLWFPWVAEYRVAFIVALLTLLLAVVRRVRVPRASQHVLFILLLALAFVSTLFSIAPDRSLEHFFMLLKSIALYFLILLVVQSASSLRRLLHTIMIYGAITTLGTLIASKLGIFKPGHSDPYRQVSVFGGIGDGPNEFGALLVTLLPLPLCLLEAEGPLRKKLPLAMLALAVMLSITRTRSRGAFVGLLVILLLLILESHARLRLALLLAPLLVFTILNTHYGYWERIATLESEESIRADSSASARLLQIQYALQLMALRPLTGVGFENFVYAKIILLGLDPASEVTQHVQHNAYLAVGSELGVFAMLLFLLVIGVSISHTYRSERLFRANNENLVLSKISKAIRIGLIGFAVTIFFLSEQLNSMLYQWIALTVVLKSLAERGALSASTQAELPSSTLRSR